LAQSEVVRPSLFNVVRDKLAASTNSAV